jgi:hypothetical protein
VSEEARPGPEPKMTGKKEALLVACRIWGGGANDH